MTLSGEHVKYAALIYAMYCTNSQAQFRDFGARIEAKQARLDAIIEGIKPVLDFIASELPAILRARLIIQPAC